MDIPGDASEDRDIGRSRSPSADSSNISGMSIGGGKPVRSASVSGVSPQEPPAKAARGELGTPASTGARGSASYAPLVRAETGGRPAGEPWDPDAQFEAAWSNLRTRAATARLELSAKRTADSARLAEAAAWDVEERAAKSLRSHHEEFFGAWKELQAASARAVAKERANLQRVAQA